MTVIGCGHLGATHAAAMAEIGHDVIGVDIDTAKINTLNDGRAWFREPQLDDLLGRHVGGRLRFTTDFAEAAAFGEIHFIGVGTPDLPDGSGYDLSQVYAAVETIAPLLNGRCLVVGKSTVPVGTTAHIQARVRELAPAGDQVEVAWSPEFLREGHAVQDTLRPDRIVAGVASPWAEKMIREAFAPIVDAGSPIIVTDPATCELVKGSANAFLATRISFINAIANLAEATGADAAVIAHAIGFDDRIGHKAMTPGLGYGGGCLPKDTRAFIARADQAGVGASFDFLRGVDAVNRDRRTHTVERVRAAAGGDLAGRRIALWGAAFKPGTDDIRDSPALDVAGRLHQAGAHVVVYDPMALANARSLHPELDYAGSALAAARGADVVLLATEWPQLRTADPATVGRAVASRVLVDARSAVDPEAWELAGWTVHRLGRG
ncbi:UDP-glucose/GDP-mannose dehydrogenase family protein [Streptomyces sp. SM12]|uniref:UDP-glucose dehydrogenase family protein n=1 Tax=Streptomyces sp. SM12 TaxID=1071602 RepID=UPI0021562CCC|nr:UDP-glucose/GDP-mannose dehydrogenase family protein [Streptomyces sp. SM12]